MKKVIKDTAIFIIFGTIYFLLECIWKGHPSHYTMFILGGMMGLVVGGLNEWYSWDLPFHIQCICGAALVTAGEGIFGLILNKLLHLNIWDYSHTWGRFFFDQCSIPFTLLWLLLSAICILLDDFIRWKLFGEEKPHYRF